MLQWDGHIPSSSDETYRIGIVHYQVVITEHQQLVVGRTQGGSGSAESPYVNRRDEVNRFQHPEPSVRTKTREEDDGFIQDADDQPSNVERVGRESTEIAVGLMNIQTI